jgi:hypothetical protein
MSPTRSAEARYGLMAKSICTYDLCYFWGHVRKGARNALKYRERVQFCADCRSWLAFWKIGVAWVWFLTALSAQTI